MSNATTVHERVLRRILRERKMFESNKALGSCTILPTATDSLITVQIPVEKPGRHYQMIIRFDFSVKDYPFRPPNYSIDRNDYGNVADENYEYSREQMRLVCPELNDWRGKDVSKLSLICSDHWSPGMNISSLIMNVRTRFAAPSFPEAYGTIVSLIEKPLNNNTFADSVVWILVGTVGEAPPSPTPGCHHFVILLDPKWCSTSTDIVHWKNQNSAFVAVAAPYCYNDEPSKKCMESLLDHCEKLGYKRIIGLSSGICVPLPSRVTKICNSTFPTSWEHVPAELSRDNGGITAGSYGG